jgi:hypothetical protein
VPFGSVSENSPQFLVIMSSFATFSIPIECFGRYNGLRRDETCPQLENDAMSDTEGRRHPTVQEVEVQSRKTGM